MLAATPVPHRMRASLTGLWSVPADRRWYVLAAVLVASGLVHLVVWWLRGGPWAGPVSFRKPFTFGLAFGVTLATLTWVTTYVAIRARTRDVLLALFAAACVVEVVVITVQSWRGVPSHYNNTTPVDAVFAYTAAGGGAVLVVITMLFAIAALRPAPAVPPSMLLAVRAGFLSFVTALLIGAAMIAIGVVQTRTASLDAAYAATGGLKSGHAATMHGILILPAVAWLASFTGWPEARRVRVVGLACAGYLLAAGAVVVETVLGADPLAPLQAPAASVLVGLGAVGLLAAGILTLTGLRTTSPAR
jgi:hypothetical protein